MDENVTIVVGSDEQPESVAKTDTPEVSTPDADTDVEERQEAYVVAPPQPAPTLEDTNEDGSDKYANYEQFLAAHSEWTMQEATRRLEERQATRNHEQAVNARHAEAVTAYRQTNPDFDAAMKSVKPVVAKLQKALGPGVLNVVDRYTTQDADHGVAVIHHLAAHPEELKRIVRLPPALQLAELGKVDALVGSASSRRPSPSATARKLQSVGIENAYGSDDFQEWKNRRNEEERSRRR